MKVLLFLLCTGNTIILDDHFLSQSGNCSCHMTATQPPHQFRILMDFIRTLMAVMDCSQQGKILSKIYLSFYIFVGAQTRVEEGCCDLYWLEPKSDSIKVCCLLNDWCCCSETVFENSENCWTDLIITCLGCQYIYKWNIPGYFSQLAWGLIGWPSGQGFRLDGTCFRLWCLACSCRKRPQPISLPRKTHTSI